MWCVKSFFISKDWLYNIKKITYQHGRFRHIHRNGWRIGRRSNCRNRSCPTCYQTVCPPKTLCTYCRGSRLHANACPYMTDPENEDRYLIILIFFFLFQFKFIFFQFLFYIYVTSIIVKNQLLLYNSLFCQMYLISKKLFARSEWHILQTRVKIAEIFLRLT